MVTDLRDFYVRAAQSTMGEVTDDLVADFHSDFARRLPEAERDRLVEWVRSLSSEGSR